MDREFDDGAAPEEALDGGQARQARRIVAIGGGKGGVGKSLLAANLGIYLTQLGKRVVLLDADLGGANLHTFLGIERPAVTLADYMDGRVTRLEDCVIQTAVNGLGLVSGEGDPVWVAHPRRSTKHRLLTRVRELDADYLICDLPPGSGFTAIDFFLLADVGLLVVVPEPTSVENTFRFIKSAFLRRLRGLKGLDHFKADRAFEGGIPSPIDLYLAARQIDEALGQTVLEELHRFRPRMVVNLTRTRADLQLGEQLRSSGRRRLGLQLDYFGYMESDDAAWLAVRKRRPLVVEHPDSKVAKNVERIARRLLAVESEKLGSPVAPRPSEQQTHYEVLEVDPGASDEEIRRAYKRSLETYARDSMAVCGLYMPERLDDFARLLADAHDVLLTPEKRRRYDVELFPDGTRPASTVPREVTVVRADDSQPRPEVPAPVVAADTEFTGDLLRRIRESRGIELIDIAQRTKIGAAQLRAIEDERWDLLPAPVYVRGFLVEYARCLRLDPAQVARTFLDRFQKARGAREAGG